MVSFLHLTMLQLGGEVKLMKEATVEVGFGWKGLKTYSKDTQYSGQVKLAGIVRKYFWKTVFLFR